MEITQLRNATVLIAVGPHRILVDPMLSRKDDLPTLRWLTRERRRNPIVELPPNSDALLASVTHCLITHCQKGHFDHLDTAGIRWLRAQKIPVVCMPGDADYLAKRRLNVAPLDDAAVSPFLGGTIRPIHCLHGRGYIGKFMAHGAGYVIDLPGEPRLYLAGDTVLTPQVKACLADLKPDVCVLPAGGAHFGFGQELIMNVQEVMAAAALTDALVIANHMDALDHCPDSRADLLAAAQREGLAHRVLAPVDGQSLTIPMAPQ